MQPNGRRQGPAAAAVAAVALLVAACGSSTHPNAVSTTTTATVGGSSPTTAAHASGTAQVAYAGSLEYLNEKTIGPAFTSRTGYAYQGRGGGSFGLSKEIAAGEIAPDVFESVGAAPIKPLEPRFTSWYVQFASSPIVVAYNPDTRFAPELKAIADGTRPLADLYSVMARPGFHLGRTNPDTDPQGQAFYEMVELAQSSLHLPADTTTKVLGAPDNSSQVFAETALEARLQAGQLDAASAFLSQAIQLHLPYVTLPAAMNFGDPALASTYARASVTITGGKVVHGVPLVLDITTIGHPTPAADAFVAYVLSPAGGSALRKGGYRLLTPTAFGNRSAIPAEVTDELGGS